MGMQIVLPLLLFLGHSSAQRGSYAGIRPIGYPAITTTTNTATAGIVDRFGEDGGTTTTMRLPPEALGDRELVDRISKLPVDKQPFWYLNWQALEANRNKPQYTNPNRPSFVNQFVETNAQTLGSRFGDDTQQAKFSGSNTQPAVFAVTTTKKGTMGLAGTSTFNGGANNGRFGSTVNFQADNSMRNGPPISGSSFSNNRNSPSTVTNKNLNSQTSTLVHNQSRDFKHTADHHHRDFRPSLHSEVFRPHPRHMDRDILTDLN